jgi:hypothetical protein
LSFFLTSSPNTKLSLLKSSIDDCTELLFFVEELELSVELSVEASDEVVSG